MGKMILIVSAVFPPEPVVSANLSYDIASNLSEKNDVVVISPEPTRPHGMVFKNTEKLNPAFNHEVLNSYTCSKSNVLGRLFESYSLGRSSSIYVKKNRSRIDCIYANTWPLFAQYFLVKTAWKYKMPIVIHIQDIYPESIVSKLPPIIGDFVRLVFLRMDKILMKKSSHIVTISPNMKDYLIRTRGLTDSKVSVVRNWQDDECFPNDPIHEDKSIRSGFTFMYLGSINESAGVELLIKAFIEAKINGARLVIAGRGAKLESCKSIAEGYANVEFWNAEKEDVPSIQAQADVLLLPLKKGIGMTASPSKLPAYMFSKKPVLASVDLESDSAKIVKSSGCGWVVEPENVSKITQKMVDIATLSQKDLDEKGRLGFDYAKEYLSRRNNLKQIINIILNSF